ncbi:hypothetical protein [Citrobacter cronae]|uniref:hypothetical protein n=1 Tax=Citrobacter cronae TaxID=1748967 RepID=UPI0021CF8F2E|nr:hypothetical protein [Citrobacter cronae]MCU6173000.1 hypothetical protein [Citrobacter cronae]
MKKTLLYVTLFSVITSSGCAVKNDTTSINGLGVTYQSDVKKLENGNYLTEVEVAPTAGRTSTAIARVTKIAVDYCNAQNKTMQEEKKVTGSHLLINGVARLVFRCI